MGILHKLIGRLVGLVPLNDVMSQPSSCERFFYHQYRLKAASNIKGL